MLAPTSHTFPINSQLSHKKNPRNSRYQSFFTTSYSTARSFHSIHSIVSRALIVKLSWKQFSLQSNSSSRAIETCFNYWAGDKTFFFYFSSICCVYADCQLIGQSVLCGKNWALSRWNIVQFFRVEQDEIKLREQRKVVKCRKIPKILIIDSTPSVR